MKALLIWPQFESFTFWNFEKVCELAGVKYMTPPLGLLTVAGLLPQDWELRLVDENVSTLTDEDITWCDVALVGSKIVHRARALEVIKRLQAAKKIVAVGGPDVTMSPEPYERAEVDFLCKGEGEVVVPRLLEDLATGKRSAVYEADRLPDLPTETPLPRFDLIDFNDYLYVGVQYSRGCPYKCEFCNVIDLFSNKYRTKTIEQVLSEFDLLYRLGYRGQLDFFDDNFVGNFNQAKPLLRALAVWLKEHDYPFTLSSSLTINVAKDDELLELLREARFKAFLVGIETPDEKSLKLARKGQNTGFSIAEAADRIYRKTGATIHSGFLLGMDGEPDDIVDQMIECIDTASIPWVMGGIVYPLPGTQLARRLDREGRLFPQARKDIADGARDQVSAGLQFVPQRSATVVVDDLVRLIHHSFEPKGYFARCENVARRLNTVPKLVLGWRIFWRNLKTIKRLCVTMLLSRKSRWPFFSNLVKVLFKNSKGVEAYIMLSVLYTHFERMLPYVYGELQKQQNALRELGEEAWLAEKLKELPAPGVLGAAE